MNLCLLSVNHEHNPVFSFSSFIEVDTKFLKHIWQCKQTASKHCQAKTNTLAQKTGNMHHVTCVTSVSSSGDWPVSSGLELPSLLHLQRWSSVLSLDWRLHYGKTLAEGPGGNATGPNKELWPAEDHFMEVSVGNSTMKQLSVLWYDLLLDITIF